MFKIEDINKEEFSVFLYAKNGTIILESKVNYTTKTDAENCVALIRINAQKEEMFDRCESSQGKFYFYLKGANDEIIGISKIYETVAARENGILSVIKNSKL